MSKRANETMTHSQMVQMVRLLKDNPDVPFNVAQALLKELPRSQRGHFAISDQEWAQIKEGEAAWLLLDIANNVPHGWTGKEKERARVLIALLEKQIAGSK